MAWNALRTLVNRGGVTYDALKTSVIFAEDMNKIKDNIEYLKENGTDEAAISDIADDRIAEHLKSAVRVIHSGANQAAANNTWVTVALNSENYDQNDEFDSVTNFKFTAKIAGKYLVIANVRIYTTGTSGCAIRVRKNVNEIYCYMESKNDFGHAVDIIDLAVGDTLDLQAIQGTGSEQVIQSGNNLTFMCIKKL